MEKDLAPKIKISEIRGSLTNMPLDEIWSKYILWVETLQYFWERTVIEFIDLIEADCEKKEKFLAIIRSSFEYMGNWRFKRIRYVKARRNEIDSTISYIRNTALRNNISDMLVAPIARNVASVLRTCLHISTHSYNDEQIPTLIAQDIYEIAACRTFFPIDLSNLVSFLPDNMTIHAEGGNADNFHLMLETAAKTLGIEEALVTLNNEAYKIWKAFDVPFEWNIPEDIWRLKTDGMSIDLYYANTRDFYSK